MTFLLRVALTVRLPDNKHTQTPEELANSLAFLQIDLSDPDFHRLALENARLLLAGYRALLDEAVAASEIVPCDTERLARAVGAVSGGSLIAWAIHREGSAEEWVREDLATFLAPIDRVRWPPALTTPALLSQGERRENSKTARFAYPSLPLGEKGQGSEGSSSVLNLVKDVAPARSRRRSEFIRAAILKALWEAEEQATAEAYARHPDNPDAAFDPAVWESRAIEGDDA